MSKTKITLTGIAGAFLSVLIWRYGLNVQFMVENAMAATPSDAPSPDFDGVMTVMASFMTGFLTAIHTLLWVLFWLLDILLRPELIFNGDVGSTSNEFVTMLKKIWVFSRDITNLVFVFIFIGGALVTVVTANSEKVLKAAPRFVISLILVNFTWFACLVLIDVSNIAAATVFNLPSVFSVGDSCKYQVMENGVAEDVPCRIIKEIRFFEETEDMETEPNWVCPLPGVVCYNYTNFSDAGSDTAFSSKIINGLVVNYAKMSLLTTPYSTTGSKPTGNSALMAYMVRLIMVAVIHIALFFPLLALVFALLVRIPILWVTMAFMPFTFIGVIMPGKLGEFDPVKYLWNNFLSAAFLPAMVAVPFSIGFILVNSGLGNSPPSGYANIVEKTLPIFAGVGTFWQLLWLCTVLGILWVGVFTALKSQKLTAGVVSKIEGMGKGMGQFALSVPLSMPFLPAPGGKGMMTLGQGMTKMHEATWRAKQGMLGSKGPDASATGGGAAASAGTSALEIELKKDATTRESLNQDIAHIVSNSSNATEIRARLQLIKTKLKAKGGAYAPLSNLQDGHMMEALSNVYSSPTDPGKSAKLQQALKQINGTTP